MSDKVNPIQRATGPSASKLHSQMLAQKKAGRALQAEQVAAKREFSEYADNFAFGPTIMTRRFKELDEKLKREVRKDGKEETDESQEVRIEGVEDAAESSADTNPELDKRALLALRGSITAEDDPDSIMRKVLDSYPDEYLADEALDFLGRTTPQNTRVGRNMFEARVKLNELYGREVKAGRNVNQEATDFSKKGLGSATALRDLYRDITGNPRHPAQMFDELSKMFKFEDLATAIKFLLHSLGADLKAKGPSIPRGLLERLVNGATTMQSILGVYRFFDSRMALISGQFNRDELDLPPRLNFEQLSKQFIKMIQERYPAPDKILKLGVMLGISDEELAQIIVFTQFRDAIRQVSPRLFKSEKHRQDMLLALLDTLSELEDLLDEEEEEDDD